MNSYTAPLRDIRFALYDVLGAEAFYQRLGIAHAQRDLIDAVLEEAAKFTQNVLAPINQSGDEQGCVYDKATGAVTTPAGFKEAYAQFGEGGWTGLTAAESVGGQDLPESLGAAVTEMLDASNLSWSNYPFLSHGVVEALKQHGEQWQRDAFLKPIIEGRWTGTMCLTESHAGSDLGMLKTRAEPNADGTYSISGSKIFITGGEHDLTENIIHLVLARLPDSPAGTKGISMFIVPKMRVARDGTDGRAQRRSLRIDRAQDGHQRLVHLRDELRQRARLPDRRAEQGPQCDVHHDECRAARGWPAGPGPDGSLVPECVALSAATACRVVPCRARKLPTNRPIRSSCMPTCDACC